MSHLDCYPSSDLDCYPSLYILQPLIDILQALIHGVQSGRYPSLYGSDDMATPRHCTIAQCTHYRSSLVPIARSGYWRLVPECWPPITNSSLDILIKKLRYMCRAMNLCECESLFPSNCWKYSSQRRHFPRVPFFDFLPMWTKTNTTCILPSHDARQSRDPCGAPSGDSLTLCGPPS